MTRTRERLAAFLFALGAIIAEGAEFRPSRLREVADTMLQVLVDSTARAMARAACPDRCPECGGPTGVGPEHHLGDWSTPPAGRYSGPIGPGMRFVWTFPGPRQGVAFRVDRVEPVGTVPEALGGYAVWWSEINGPDSGTATVVQFRAEARRLSDDYQVEL